MNSAPNVVGKRIQNKAAFRRVRWAAAMAVVGAVWQVTAPHALAEDRAQEGLSASDWSSIRAAYEANRHAAFAVEGGFQARNPGQQWRTNFDGRGFETTPDAGGWSWGLELVSYGRGVAPALSRSAPVVSNTCGQRVEYEWDDNLTEWHINDSRGLEHGFTMLRRPDAINAAASPGGRTMVARGFSLWNECRLFSSARRADESTIAPLQITLAVRGDLEPKISTDRRNLGFINSSGAAVVNYNGLSVFDATGANLPAWFEVVDPNSQFSILHSQFIRIIIDDADAIYPLTIDPIAQLAYLKASNTGGSDDFGRSVAISGDTVVVGAPREDSSATGVNGNQADNSTADSGAAYVFIRSSGVWSQQAYLKASNTEVANYFGFTVTVSGDTLVVGAPEEDSSATGVNGNQADNSAFASGAAYVFIRNVDVWSQQAYLKASNTGELDQFGTSLAASGDTVVIGAYLEDSNATGIDGNQADESAAEAGAAYVFVRNGTTWSQQAYLKASNTGVQDVFGYSLAVSGDTVVVGALGEASSASGVNDNQADNSAVASGAAYVFIRNVDVWSQQAYLKASNTGELDQFGTSLAASGDTVVVGAMGEDSSATGVNGNQADNSASNSGATYVFARIGGLWSQQAYLKASNTGANDLFGRSVAASGDTTVVGADFEASGATGVNGNQADNSAGDSGAAYVFIRSAGVWSQQAYLKASNTEVGDYFGISVAVSGDTVVVGAFREDSSATGVNGNQADNIAADSGAAYVFIVPPPDADGDGVPDASDVCPNNTSGLPVDCTGRPLRDCSNDCVYDAADIQCLVDEMLNQ